MAGLLTALTALTVARDGTGMIPCVAKTYAGGRLRAEVDAVDVSWASLGGGSDGPAFRDAPCDDHGPHHRDSH